MVHGTNNHLLKGIDKERPHYFTIEAPDDKALRLAHP